MSDENRSTGATGEVVETGVTQKAFLFGPDGEVLLTRTDDTWLVPGGKFEHGETMPGGLRRELREEVAVDARIGTPVGVIYGAWLTENGEPLVTLFYHAVTDDRAVTLNEEHDEAAWLNPAEARERIATGDRGERLLARAVTIDRLVRADDSVSIGAADDSVPFGAASDDGDAGLASGAFRARADPYEDCDTDTAERLTYLSDARELSLDELREKYR